MFNRGRHITRQVFFFFSYRYYENNYTRNHFHQVYFSIYIDFHVNRIQVQKARYWEQLYTKKHKKSGVHIPELQYQVETGSQEGQGPVMITNEDGQNRSHQKLLLLLRPKKLNLYFPCSSLSSGRMDARVRGRAAFSRDCWRSRNKAELSNTSVLICSMYRSFDSIKK